MLKGPSKFLCRNFLCFLYCSSRNSGSIKEAGGKWAEMQAAHEGEYFHKKNQEYLEYIKEELKKGRNIEDVIEDTRRELKARKKCQKGKGLDSEVDDDDCE